MQNEKSLFETIIKNPYSWTIGLPIDPHSNNKATVKGFSESPTEIKVEGHFEATIPESDNDHAIDAEQSEPKRNVMEFRVALTLSSKT